MAFLRNPVVYVPDLANGRPIVDGKVYALAAGTVPPMHDSAIDPADLLTVTFVNEAGNTVEQPQPLYTSKGGCLFGNYPDAAVQYMITPQEYVYAVYNRIGQLEYSGQTSASDYVETDALAAVGSTVLVGGAEAGKVGSRAKAFYLVSDFESLKVGSDWTAAIQAAIDAANSTYMGGSYGGGSVEVIFPAGEFEYTSLLIKKGVSLRGQGIQSTILKLMGATSTGIKCQAATTQLAADQVSYGHFIDILFRSGESAPTSQTIWDATGFSRWSVERCWFEWFNGCTAISVLGATLAGSGGPAQWYNSFYDCFFYRSASRPSGGVALNLGDIDVGKEQVTTWRFFGGHISGAGSGDGVRLRGTGCSFIGMTFESLVNAVTLGSTSTRGALSNSFISCYWEGNTVNRLIEANATNNVFAKSFVTGGTTTDNSTSSIFDEAGNYRAYLPNSGRAKYEIEMANGASKRPKFKGSTVPAIGIENSSATELVLMNGAASSAANSYYRFLNTGAATVLLEGGTSLLRPGDDNVKSLGSASSRWSVVYAGTGTINTSDAREKTEVRPFTANELAAAKELAKEIGFFKWLKSVEEKGDEAREHCGMTVQRIIEIMEAHGLDPFNYGMICYDSWEETPEVSEQVEVEQEDGSIALETVVTTPYAPAGDRYAIRDDQIKNFVIRGFEERLDALEAAC